MYSFMGQFMSYRRYYVWRARYRYYTRDMNAWTVACGLLLLGLLLMFWLHLRVQSVPAPRVHPQAAELRVRMITEQAFHRIGVVRRGGDAPGSAYDSPAAIREGTERTLRVRQTLREAEALQLHADMFADMADYITASGVCAPYNCWYVGDRIQRLRNSGARSAEINAGLEPVLEVPADVWPHLKGERLRVQGGWSDDFQDVLFHTWLLADVQQMHAQMMREYPERAPMPWLSRLMATPEEPSGPW